MILVQLLPEKANPSQLFRFLFLFDSFGGNAAGQGTSHYQLNRVLLSLREIELVFSFTLSAQFAFELLLVCCKQANSFPEGV
jgi:hypothetical protein